MSRAAFSRLLSPSDDRDDDVETHLAAYEALRQVLVREMRRRGLWHGSPRHLGVVGLSAWNLHDGSLDELVNDCFVFVLVHRRRALSERVEAGDDVASLVRLNVRHFLFELQRRHDPVGYRVFKVLERAIALLVERRRLRCVGGHPARLRSRTVLAFVAEGTNVAPDAPVRPTRLDAEPIATWADCLAAAIVEARGRQLESVAERLAERLPELAEHAEAFHFGQLARLLKTQVRLRWSAVLSAEPLAPSASGAVAVLDLTSRREGTSEVEARFDFRRLSLAVERRLRRLETRRQTREYLLRLWRHLSTLAVEGGALNGSELPSHRQLARDLSIPRDRLPGLYATLRQEIERSRRLLSDRRSASRPRLERPTTATRLRRRGGTGSEALGTGTLGAGD
ncbi:MAG: hypothetical protein AAGN46_09650 [Acidobacteriota bacterium]